MPKVLVVHKHSRKYSYEVKPIITERSIHKYSDGCHLMKTECTVRQNAAKQLLQKEPDPKHPEDQKKAVATTDVNPPHHRTGQLQGSGLSPDHESSDCTSASSQPISRLELYLQPHANLISKLHFKGSQTAVQ